MDDAVRALLRLWDVTDDAVAHLEAADWARPLVPSGSPAAVASAALDTGGTDVTDLVTHLSGVRYAGPDRLREALGEAHDRAERSFRCSAPSGGELEAQCLDMCLHTHDLYAAIGLELDADAVAPAAVEACRLVSALLPRLVTRTGTRPTCLRLLVRAWPGGPVEIERTVRLGTGPALATAEVDAEADAFLLLVAGRRSAAELAEQGRVSWHGRSAETLVGA